MTTSLPNFKNLLDIERIESLLQNRLGPEPPAHQIKKLSLRTPSKMNRFVIKIVSKRNACLPPVLHAPLRATRRHTETQGSQLHNTHTHTHTHVLTWRCPDTTYNNLQTVSKHTSCVGKAILHFSIIYLVLQWPVNYQLKSISHWAIRDPTATPPWTRTPGSPIPKLQFSQTLKNKPICNQNRIETDHLSASSTTCSIERHTETQGDTRITIAQHTHTHTRAYLTLPWYHLC